MKLCWIFLTLCVQVNICVPQLVPGPGILSADNERLKQTDMDEKAVSSKELKGIAQNEDTMSKSRQLETIAFPVGIAIGAIGAALWPTIFPGNSNNTTTTTTTTTTAPTTTTTQRSNDYDDFFIVEVDSSLTTTEKTTTTTTTTTSTTTTTTTTTTTKTTTKVPATTTTSTTTTTTSTTTTTTTTTTTSGPRSVLSDFPDCGVKGTSNRVIGGTDVAENEYPWLCSLKYNDYHICGMTLISGPPHDTILVGAAHCFTAGDKVDNYRITCGEHSLRGRGEYEVTLQVTEVVIHPKYVESSTSGFDIAVFKVNEAPLNGKMIRKKLWPVCLPDIDRDHVRETVYVAGWGITKNKYIQGTKIAVKGIPDIARHADVTVTECRDLDSSRFPMGLVCAAESGRDSCQGDSGGPLVGTAFKYSNSTQKRLSWIGIVSYGIGCAEPGYPGAYTRSSCFLGFVAEQFGLKADFPAANENPSWSTDCPHGASKRSSSVKRRKHKKKNKTKIKTRR